jgi:hypothetical protein
MRVERPSVSDYTTTGNSYVDVPFTKEGSTDTRVYWDAWHLAGVKILHFFATTKDLKVQILGSIDGTNFDTTLVAEFTLTAGSSTPVEKRIVAYWPYIKVQVKPSSSDQHGTLSVRAIGTTVSGESDTELTATIDPTGLATSAKQDSLIAKFPDQSGGKVPVLANINGDLPDTSASDLAHIHAAAESIKTAVEGATPAGTAIIGKVGIDKTTPGTTNQVTVDGTGQSADIKVSLDSEKVAISGIDAGTNYIGKTGMVGFKILQSFTRPSDGNAYIAGDAISNSTSAPAIMSQDLASFGGAYGRFLVITNARVISSIKGSGLAANICIFPATFAATNDNAELSIDDTTAALGGLIIPCGNNYTFAVNSRAVSDPGWWEMQLGAASTTVYFALQAASGYTPTSGEVFTVVMEGFFL